MAFFARFCFIPFNMYLVTISCISYPSLYAGYIVSVRRITMDNIVLVKSSC